MDRIKELGVEDVGKICASQVITGLNAATKELVENSLDAKSTSIDVYLHRYDPISLVVIDNGGGIDPDDLTIICRKHTTNKLNKFDDIYDEKVVLATMGFRGEALHSLCRSSTSVTISSCRSGYGGIYAEYGADGELIRKMDTQMTSGTKVEVLGMFSTLPVRKKEVLANIRSQAQAVIKLFQAYSICHYNVRLALHIQNDASGQMKKVFESTPTDSILSSFCKILKFPKEQFNLINFESKCDIRFTYEEEGKTKVKLLNVEYQVTAGFGKPFQVVGAGSKARHFFFKNRPMHPPKKIYTIIDQTFKQFSSRPASSFFILLSAPNTVVDMNVTPDKQTCIFNSRFEKIFLEELSGEIKNKFSTFSVPLDQVKITSPIRPSSKRGSLGSNFGIPDNKRYLISEEITPTGTMVGASTDIYNSGDNNTDISPKYIPARLGATRNITHNGGPKELEMDIYTDINKDILSNEHMENASIPSNKDLTDDQKCLKKNTRCESDTNIYICRKPDLDTPKGNYANFTPSPKIPSSAMHLSALTPNENDNKRPNKFIATNTPVNSDKDNIENKCNNIKNSIMINRERLDTIDAIGTVLECDNPIYNEVVSNDKDTNDILPISNNNGDTNDILSISNNNGDTNDILSISNNNQDNYVMLTIQNNNPDPLDTQLCVHAASAISLIEEKIDIYIPDITIYNQKELFDEDLDMWIRWGKMEDSHVSSGVNMTQAGETLENVAENPDVQYDKSSLELLKECLSDLVLHGQFNKGFLVASLPAGQERDVFLIDQHASDEKIQFEYFIKNLVINNQATIAPKKLNLPPDKISWLDEYESLPLLKGQGFDIQFLEDGYYCLGYPIVYGLRLENQDISDLIELYQSADSTMVTFDCLNSYKNEASKFGSHLSSQTMCRDDDKGAYIYRPPRLWKYLASKACRSALMIGETIQVTRMYSIVEKLSTLNQPWNCPHGRPTLKYAGRM